MEKTYQPHQIEAHWCNTWEAENYFSPRGDGTGYCIVIPPPNVTGTLHMGHGFQYSIMDALIRYHRMLGEPTLWQVGMDHAGIATQLVVERQLEQQGLERVDLTREEFLNRVWEWKENSGATITKQLRRLGASVDWSQERFTLDPEFSAAVQHVFIQLYRDGLIYRGTRLVNWDPKLQTAISDLEAVIQEEEGDLWSIAYPIVDSNDSLVVATTRPETLFGDAAVAVHPADERYQKYIGKEVYLPLTEKKIPIIADHYVDPEFGTGCVKITPAHDFNDYEVGKRHQLPFLNIFTSNGELNENVPAFYQGLDRFVARERVIVDLQNKNLLVDHKKYFRPVPRSEKSGVVVEPYLTTQWYVKMKSLAESALKVVAEKQINFIPDSWKKVYDQWLENIEDWCISRQLWWGHRIPAWYDEEGNVYVGETEEAIRKKYDLKSTVVLWQEEDVLDTWFSSALWPFAALGWPQQTPRLEQFFPTAVLVTGFDIIFFWVARMIMMSLHFTGEIPFHTVYITGLIRDSEGQKMSKSKGNIIDPLDLIDGIGLEKLLAKRTQSLLNPKMAAKIAKQTQKEFPEGIASYGADALRLTFLSFAGLNREIRFDLKRLEGYRNFCNKLWNAARFVLANLEDFDLKKYQSLKLKENTTIDAWLSRRLQATIQEAHHYFSIFRFDLLVKTLYEFTWNEFCDWYLEMSKTTLEGEDRLKTQYTLLSTLEKLLRLWHPLIPFITEEIWQSIAKALAIPGDTLMLQSYPEVPVLSEASSESAFVDIEWLKTVVTTVRTIRSEVNVPPQHPVKMLIRKVSVEEQTNLQHYFIYLKSLAKVTHIEYVNNSSVLPIAATGLVGDMEIFIPLEGLIDPESEFKRLQKEILKLEKSVEISNHKLQNSNFIDNAPPDVIAKEKERLKETTDALEKLTAHYQRILLLKEKA